jgi:hypothetical protein
MGEEVTLVREPNNRHDRWAIRVENTEGTKIGYIKRADAKAISQKWDSHIGDVEVAATVTGHASNDYQQRLRVEMTVSYHGTRGDEESDNSV